jgi:hypothetical protein
MRVITLDANKKVISVKTVGDSYILQLNDIITDLGDIGMIQQLDGSFIIDTTPIPPQPPSDLELLKAGATRSQGALDYIIMNF